MSQLRILESERVLLVDHGIVPFMEMFPWRLASQAGKTLRAYVPLTTLSRNLYAIKVAVLSYKMSHKGPHQREGYVELCQRSSKGDPLSQQLLYSTCKALHRLRTIDGNNLDLRRDNIPAHYFDRPVSLTDDPERPLPPSGGQRVVAPGPAPVKPLKELF